MSNFKSKFEQGIKANAIKAMSPEAQRQLKYNSLMSVVNDIGSKKNRFIFYCPDIAVVNPLVKMVYDIAHYVQNAGYNVVVLHEINGFRAKWLYEHDDFKDYRKVPVEYIMNKAGKKSRKDKNLYTFKPSDTLIVTDAFQEMLENLAAEPSLRLVQKVVLVTGYMGLKSLSPGTDYEKLGVSSMIFFDDSVRNDYEDLFALGRTYLLDNYPIASTFSADKTQTDNIYPVIGITSIGNNDIAQQLINIFYNKYPNFSMFTFKIIGRDTLDDYIDNITSSAGVVLLDKDVVTKQSALEIINTGTPIFLNNRREYHQDQMLMSNFVVEGDMFDMANRIAEFCQYWLTVPNQDIKDHVLQLGVVADLAARKSDLFESEVVSIFDDLHNNRAHTFDKLMSLLFNITAEEVRLIVGEDLWKLTEAYIYEFFALETSNNLEIVIKAIANTDGSFSIYDIEHDALIVMIVPNRFNDYYVQPVGVCRILMSKIFDKFDMIEKHHEFTTSVYQMIFQGYETNDADRVDTFLFYMSIILIDTFGLDIYDSHAKMERRSFSLSGHREEFVPDGNGGVNYDKVSYLISMSDEDTKINIIKMYSSEKLHDDVYSVDVYDIIYNCIKQC